MTRPDRENRLDLLARYARAVVAQEERLLAGDEDGFARHARERQELQERVDALTPLDEGRATDPEEHLEVVRLLEEAWASDRRIRERMRDQRAHHRADLDAVERRGDQARRYLAGGRGAQRALDVTF